MKGSRKLSQGLNFYVLRRSVVIDRVIDTPLRQIVDECGEVLHMLGYNLNHFLSFGEVYFSLLRVGIGVHEMIQKIFHVPNNCNLVDIPSIIWNSFKGISAKTSVIRNCVSIPHDSK